MVRKLDAPTRPCWNQCASFHYAINNLRSPTSIISSVSPHTNASTRSGSSPFSLRLKSTRNAHNLIF